MSVLIAPTLFGRGVATQPTPGRGRDRCPSGRGGVGPLDRATSPLVAALLVTTRNPADGVVHSGRIPH